MSRARPSLATAVCASIGIAGLSALAAWPNPAQGDDSTRIEQLCGPALGIPCAEPLEKAPAPRLEQLPQSLEPVDDVPPETEEEVRERLLKEVMERPEQQEAIQDQRQLELYTVTGDPDAPVSDTPVPDALAPDALAPDGAKE